MQKPDEKPKICFVIQRYGVEVNGGAELHCMQLAEKMTRYCDVSVLTTKAKDYRTWRNEYPEDFDEINGVHVIRKSVERERDPKQFDEINAAFFMNELPESREQDWLDSQGPYSPALIMYLRSHRDDYDVFIFFCYLYYQTVMGIKEVYDKAIMLSLTHDEPFLRMKIFDDVFYKPRAFFFNTDDERRLVRRVYRNYSVPYRIGGVGVDVPAVVSAERFREKYGIDDYIIYVGRIDEGKNCHELFRQFLRFKEENPGPLKLVLMGKAMIDIPETEDIVSLGFVDEQDKFDGIAGSRLLVLPSIYESLSMVVLEAFSLKRPVLVNGKCVVLRNHCLKSGGGFYYENDEEFSDKLSALLADEELNARMGALGSQYVAKNYNWDVIVKKFRELVYQISGKTDIKDSDPQ